MRITVLGRAQPAGSKRAFPNPKTGKIIVTDDAKQSRPWKQQVAGAARAEMSGEQAWDHPIKLTVLFVVGRPKGHYRTGRNAGLLREGAPSRPTVRPDATKLLRAVEDALTGIVWRDDAQVVDQHVAKVYGHPERCEIEIFYAPPELDYLVFGDLLFDDEVVA